jgi:SAM-dependent methyltransferase
MRIQQIKQWLAPLRRTPFHPQWMIRKGLTMEDLADFDGLVLDVGCADGSARQLLPASAEYIGLDYYRTAVEWYQTQPDLFGDARNLPIDDESVDGVLLIHVLEHLDKPGHALGEVTRVLSPGGFALIEVPFIYPVHDAPLDFRRWTEAGLRLEATTKGLNVVDSTTVGRASETAVLVFNLAISRLVLNWIEERNLLLLLTPVTALLILLMNLLGAALAPLYRSSDFMPHRCRLLCRKPAVESDE